MASRLQFLRFLFTKRSLNSPFLLSHREMQRLVSKERLRCERHRTSFGLVLLHLQCDSREKPLRILALAKLLQQRLRLYDEKGLWEGDRLAILLPHTDRDGARSVVSSISRMAARADLHFIADVVVYPEESAQSEDGENGRGLQGIDAAFDRVTNDDSEQTFPCSLGSAAESASAMVVLDRPPVAGLALRSSEGFDKSQVVANSSELAMVLELPYPRWKRGIDILASLLGLSMGFPLMVIAAVGIKLTSRGPIIYSQMRTGWRGQRFRLYKFRTMVVNAESQKEALMERNERDGPAFKVKGDPRITPIGSLLRATGIDEIPQLWNVIRGEMSLVGPRPLPCGEDEQCQRWQRRRLDTKPGLTCSWQVSKSRKISFANWMRMDIHYVDQRSLTGDLILMWKTVLAMLLGRIGH
jgi:lipopolysaccharide/colanic/teichoic acid biosynthesis glycosyltransferase